MFLLAATLLNAVSGSKGLHCVTSATEAILRMYIASLVEAYTL